MAAPKLQGYEDGFFLGGCLSTTSGRDADLQGGDLWAGSVGVRAADFEEAVKLSTSMIRQWRRDFTATRRGARITTRIQIGMVGVTCDPVRWVHSFGGWKRSLFGDMAVPPWQGCGSTRVKT